MSTEKSRESPEVTPRETAALLRQPEECSRFEINVLLLTAYIGLPSMTVVPVGDWVATVLVSSNPAER